MLYTLIYNRQKKQTELLKSFHPILLTSDALLIGWIHTEEKVTPNGQIISFIQNSSHAPNSTVYIFLYNQISLDSPNRALMPFTIIPLPDLDIAEFNIPHQEQETIQSQKVSQLQQTTPSSNSPASGIRHLESDPDRDTDLDIDELMLEARDANLIPTPKKKSSIASNIHSCWREPETSPPNTPPPPYSP